MNLTKELDLAIKALEGGGERGYRVGEREFSAYVTNEAWEGFLAAMPREAYEAFASGGGDELSEKRGLPPKMASFGSSSRMIYRLSREKAGFVFEKKLPTTVGGISHLDGFCDEPGRYLCVEAKCHEFYQKAKTSVSKSYEALYRYISEATYGMITVETAPSRCGRYLEARYFAEGEELLYFDVKQLISHYLGIATAVLTGKMTAKQVDFVYLVYDPTDLLLSPSVREAVDEAYARLSYECNLVDHASLFGAILSYLKEHHYPDTAVSDYELELFLYAFTFSLVTHELYPVLLG